MVRGKVVLVVLGILALSVASVSALAVALRVSGLDAFLSNEYVPTAEKIVAGTHLQPFLVDAFEIEGVYGNMDVDSVIFRYRTEVRDAERFMELVEERRRGTAWTPLPPHGKVKRYQRIFPKGDKMFAWVEELRLRHSPDGTVIVGWVQADPWNDVNSLDECSEARFAHSVIWPALEE